MSTEREYDEIYIKGKIVGDLNIGDIDFIPYLIYSNPNLEYKLFANSRNKLYIIKNK